MTYEHNGPPNKRSGGDYLHSLTRAGISLIPFAGAPASELLNILVTPPLERRKQEWLTGIGERLRKLEEEGVSLEDLRNNEDFIDVVMEASLSAMRTHNAEKKTALRNAVVNCAKGDAPESALQKMFIAYIDDFTVWHIKLLELLSDPSEWARRHNHEFPRLPMGELNNIVESAFPELRGRRDLYDQIWRDLYSRGLTDTDSLHGTMSGDGLMERRASSIGRAFIDFILEHD